MYQIHALFQDQNGLHVKFHKLHMYITDNPTSFVSVVSIYLKFLSDLFNIITITTDRDT